MKTSKIVVLLLKRISLVQMLFVALAINLAVTVKQGLQIAKQEELIAKREELNDAHTEWTKEIQESLIFLRETFVAIDAVNTKMLEVLSEHVNHHPYH